MKNLLVAILGTILLGGVAGCAGTNNYSGDYGYPYPAPGYGAYQAYPYPYYYGYPYYRGYVSGPYYRSYHHPSQVTHRPPSALHENKHHDHEVNFDGTRHHDRRQSQKFTRDHEHHNDRHLTSGDNRSGDNRSGDNRQGHREVNRGQHRTQKSQEFRSQRLLGGNGLKCIGRGC
jgi:hypothetical protein